MQSVFLKLIQQVSGKHLNPSDQLFMHISRILCFWVNKPNFVNKMGVLLLAMGYQKIYEAMIYDARKQSN